MRFDLKHKSKRKQIKYVRGKENPFTLRRNFNDATFARSKLINGTNVVCTEILTRNILTILCIYLILKVMQMNVLTYRLPIMSDI